MPMPLRKPEREPTDWDAEFLKWLKTKRADAIDVIRLPKNWISLYLRASTFVFYSAVLVLNRDIYWRFQYGRRRKGDDQLLKQQRIDNMIPEIKQRREWLRKEKIKCPVYLKEFRQRACEWFKRNKHKAYAYRNARRKTNKQFQIGSNLRTYIYQRVGAKNTTGQSRFLEVVGCSIVAFCQWLEAHFEPGMSWDNYGKGDGKWSIDHTLPCASFDLTDPVQVRRCFHFSNMLPMWWRENLAKRDKILFSN